MIITILPVVLSFLSRRTRTMSLIVIYLLKLRARSVYDNVLETGY